MSDSRTKNVIKNSGASLAYKVIHLVLTFALRTAFIRLLGNEYTGISGLFTDILQVLSLMELGLDTSMVYALYKPVAENDHNTISALLNFYKKAFTYIGIVILVFGLACIPFLDHIVNGVPNIKEDIRLIFLMYILTSASSYFVIYKTMLLKAKQQSRIISNVYTTTEIIEFLISIVILIFFKEFFLYLIVHLIATWTKNIYLSHLTQKMYPDSFVLTDAKLLPHEKRGLIRDIICLTVYTLSGVVINSTDSIFISAFVGTVEVAVIGNFTIIINSVRTTVEQINNSLKASVGNLAATSSSEKQEQVFDRILFLCFWAVCVTATCLYTLLNSFVGDVWLGEEYTIPQVTVGLLVINYFIAIMVYPVESFRTANGLFIQGWYRPAVMAVLNIVLDYYMGKTMGIDGIFLATTISRVLTQVWFDPYLVYKYVFHKTPWRFYGKYLLYAIVSGISCFVAWRATGFCILGNRLLCFMVDMVISLIIPNAIVLLLFGKTKEFAYYKELIGKVIPNSR